MWAGLPCGEKASSRKRKSVTSRLRVYESHIQTSLPLMNQHPEMANSLLHQLLFRGTFHQPLKLCLSGNTAAQDGLLSKACGFPTLLHPARAHRGQRFWLLASKWLLGTAHKAAALQFCPERELFLESEVWHLKAEYNMLSDQRKAFSNFYLYLLLLFVNIQYPDFSLILLPAFLAISLLSLLPAVPPIAFLLLLLFSLLSSYL